MHIYIILKDCNQEVSFILLGSMECNRMNK